jgi:hypothetical protein
MNGQSQFKSFHLNNLQFNDNISIFCKATTITTTTSTPEKIKNKKNTFCFHLIFTTGSEYVAFLLSGITSVTMSIFVLKGITTSLEEIL